MDTQFFRSGYFAGTRGTNLYYRGWMPPQIRALMILVHGAGEHSGVYSDIGEECLRRQIGLIAPDLRGFGQSDGARGHVDRFEEYLDDLETLAARLEQQYPAVPLFLLGHSLGGLIVIRYAQENLRQVKGVMLSSPALGIRFRLPYPLKKLINLISWAAPNLPVKPFKWSWLTSTLLANPANDLRDPLFTTQYTPRWFSELLRNGAHALSQAAKCSLPTLCLCGQHDPLIDLEAIEHFFQSIATDDKAYLVFPGVRHRPLHEPCREEAVRKLFEWMTARL
ncbi:MAG: alpha/beta hydrolase [Brevibacillus sp.]|nr:alpha/beta hydrolase [Brevibacillus sp.]